MLHQLLTHLQEIARTLATIAGGMRPVNLLGKDYLNVEEAAYCACVSVSQFRAHAAAHGIYDFRFMGRVCYRKADILKAMEKQWQLYNGEKTPPVKKGGGYFNGLTPKARTASPSAKSAYLTNGAPVTSSAPSSSNSAPAPAS